MSRPVCFIGIIHVAICWAILLPVASVLSADGVAGSTLPIDDEDDVFLTPPQPRIIGGTNAREARYPYMATLLDIYGMHSCGGTLVAPDMILTAGHCQKAIRRVQVGRWNREDPSEDFEDIAVVSPEFIHPLYSDGDSYPNDYMLLKLVRKSTKPYIRLNFNSSVPTGQNVDEVTVIGFGNTVPGVSSLSDILQEVDLTYVPNAVCELSKDQVDNLEYAGKITTNMICAQDNGQDSCQGDSGGPLIVKGGTAESDVLVGITSWGYGCANPAFPGVYARISAEYDWITGVVCEVSDDPPSEFGCSGANVDGRPVPVTMAITLDNFPDETSWSIYDKLLGTVYVDVPFGEYNTERGRVVESLSLPAGGDFVLVVRDSFGDGLCCNTPGNFVLSLGSEPNGPILVSGGGKFDRDQLFEFSIPLDYEENSAKAPFAVGEGEITLTIAIQLDATPQEIGWRVDLLGVEVENLIDLVAGGYTLSGEQVVRTLVLQKDEAYYFRLYDINSNGIDGGYVKLFLGTTDISDTSRMIYESDGNFEAGVDLSFIADLNWNVDDTPVIENDSYLSLQLFMDLYPGEVGVQLRASNVETAIDRQTVEENTVIFFRPPKYYDGLSNQVVTEKIAIPASRQGASREFYLIVTDSFNDGLCCNWNRTERTGYALYEGDVEGGVLLVESKFIDVAREVSAFRIEGPSDPVNDNSQNQSKEQVDILVTITLDIYPEETGFYLADMSGFRIMDVPPGSYNVANDIVEERLTIPVGLYNFTITDSYGDGITTADGFYSIELVNEVDRVPVFESNGVFVSHESNIILLEGKSADYPIDVRFSGGDEQGEIGFYVKRLDLEISDGYVARVLQGSFMQEGEEITESISVQAGGLYLLAFEDAGKDGIGSEVEIVVGPDIDVNQQSIVIDARDLLKFETRIPAGRLPESGPQRLDFRLTFDQYPREVEWILVSGDSPLDHEVVAFGPTEEYSEALAGLEYTESIFLPLFSGQRTFTMIVTDSTGDGICCQYGAGGPVEVYAGPASDGNLMFSVPFEGKSRISERFVLVGEGRSISQAYAPPSSVAFAAAILVATLMTII